MLRIAEKVKGTARLLQAAAVLCRRGMVDPRRPRYAIAASRALRRYGAFGGLVAYTAARYGDAPAITDDNETVSYRELDRRSDVVAQLILDGAGRRGVVALLRRNSAHVVVELAAANKAGVRCVLLNTGFAAPQLADVCTREGVTAVIADDEYADRLESLPDGCVRLDVDGASAAYRPHRLPAPDCPGGLVLLTSGTTGTPKGAPRERISPLQSAQLLDRIPWPQNSTYCVAAPLFHATGLATCSVGLALGNRVVLSRRFDPVVTLGVIERYRAGAVIVVPTMLSRLLDLSPDVLDSIDTSSLRVVFAAGSSLSPALCRRTAARFGEVLYNLYGSTEVATAAVATPEELRQAPGTVGRPPVGCTVAVYERDGTRVTTPGRVGTLYVSSGLSFSGYTGGGHKKVIDGLLSTGDTGHFDENGLWFIDGRDDDMIVSGGENVYPLEVENLLVELPGVLDAAVVGVDDADFGSRLRAFVVADPGAAGAGTVDAEAIRDAVRARLARHKVPRDVVFVAELPRNDTGKVLKKRLAEMGPHRDDA
ncbi:MAG: AMP-binding protein [Actinomycetota bacterium]